MTATGCSFFQQALPLINARLDALVPTNDSSEVIEAARYALLGPGKKLRPALAIATYMLYHDDPSPILDAACSLEMIHTYSLIHDDLPGLDNDDMRRGRPTVHKAFSESSAILAGDLLLTHAFGTLADCRLDPNIRLQMISEMSRLSGGFTGMIAGQAIDLKSEGKHISEEELEQLHSLKTGALIELSVTFGILAANPPPEDSRNLMRFAKLYGLAFQVVDDIIDVLHPLQKHGKAVSSDLINDKATYVSLLGLEGAQQKAAALIKEAEECLDKLRVSSSSLKEFLSILSVD
jgi:geranylgeranyl diphosphate synthase type II